MKKIIAIMMLALTVFATSCTDNARVKTFGGEATLNLEKGKKLVNVTWKEQELWLLTKKMSATDSAETYNFGEKSSFGMIEGNYIIVESK